MSVLYQKVGVRIWTVDLLSTALILGLMLSLGTGSIKAATEQATSADLLKFTAGGHVLGFQPGSFIAAGSDHALKVEFIGARPVSPQATNASLKASKGVQPLDKVTYTDLWEGVTLVYDGGDGILESTYHIAPQKRTSNGSPFVRPVDRIRLRYNVPVALDGNGNLLLKFKTGQMQESAPVAWQEISGKRVSVRVAFRILGEKDVGFSTGNYDPALSLVIDPVLRWNTFMGGCYYAYDQGDPILIKDSSRDITVDALGNVYVAGESFATWDSPVNAYSGSSEAFAAKLDSNGNRIWNTFMGSEGSDDGLSMAIDADGNVYVAGESNATWGAPVNPHAGSVDAFVVKLDNNGNRIWNTFMGSEGQDRGGGIAVDALGNVYVAGRSYATWGAPVNAHAGWFDAFAAKLDNNGNGIWNTFMGSSESTDYGDGIAVDALGKVYLAGRSYATWGSPVDAHSGGTLNNFAAKLDSDGNRLWNTFIGLGRGEKYYKNGIAVDATGNVYVAGTSKATWGSPINAFAGYNDAFAAKLDSDGNRLWNTFMGGQSDDRGFDIAVDTTGNLYVAGYSSATWGSPINPISVCENAFVVKLDGNGSRLWNTFMGVSKECIGDGTYAYGITVDATQNVYVAGNSPDIWGTPVDQDDTCGAFAAKLVPLAMPWMQLLLPND
jgi:hypothetical protein